jgi:phthalate 4,5-cis-dihydrodiol dehydrogenase
MKPLGLGVVGLGRGFLLTLPSIIAHPRIQLVAGCDPREEAVSRFAREFQGSCYFCFEELLRDPAVEAVYVASPHQFHRDQAIAAAKTGKHLLIEKPMAITIEDGLAIERAAEAAGIVTVVGPSHGLDLPVRYAAALISDGRFGRPRMITAMNYTDFVMRPRRPEELVRSRGGGVVFSQGAHQIDIARRLMGTAVESVRAVVGDWDPARPTDGAYTALLTFEGGGAASLSYSGYGRYDSNVLLGGISELGHVVPAAAAPRSSTASEANEKIARTFGPLGSGDLQLPRHHEHFGWVLVSCEGADLRLMADEIIIHERGRTLSERLPPPTIPRAGALDALVEGVRLGRAPLQDAAWGTATVACCQALLRSSDEAREVALSEVMAAWETRA